MRRSEASCFRLHKGSCLLTGRVCVSVQTLLNVGTRKDAIIVATRIRIQVSPINYIQTQRSLVQRTLTSRRSSEGRMAYSFLRQVRIQFTAGTVGIRSHLVVQIEATSILLMLVSSSSAADSQRRPWTCENAATTSVL